MAADRIAQIAQLQAEIADLQQALAAQGDRPVVRRTLETELATKQRALAALQGAPTAGMHGTVTNSGTLHGNAIGVNYGSAQSDEGRGNQTVNQGPQIYGPISSGRDTNIATHQTIANATAPEPAAPAPTTPPELRLWLEGQDGAALSALMVGAEALLRVGPTPGAALPDLTLQLEASGAGLEWPDGTRRTLAVGGGAVARTPRWALIPSQAGPLTLRVLVLIGGALVQQLALVVECRPSGAAVLSSNAAGAAAPLPTVAVGLALSSAPSLPTHANALTLVLDREREGFALRLIDGGSVTNCALALTDTGLSDLLAYTRTELLAIVHQDDGQGYVFQEPDLAIPTLPAEAALRRLARVGASLWQALFAGPGSSQDLLALGERLRARSQAGALHLTIAAARLPFPWALLYDRDPNAAIVPDGFWGFRHVVASLPTSGRSRPKAGDLSLGPAKGLRALVGLNLTIDQGDDPPVIPDQRQAFAELRLVAEEVTTEPALQAAIAAGTDAALIYLYCHVNSVAPGGPAVRPGEGGVPGAASSAIVLTSGGNGLTLRNLQLAAPLGPAPLLRGGPLVVLNACGSAELSPLTYEGLAPYLLDQGARAVVGTECETPIFFGAAFGVALLRAVVADRLSVGEALRATRRAFFEQQQNPLGLLYALYGSADLRVQQEQD